jgi:NADH:ubiquinone oxidoreductase subunit 2 (subunit N)
MRQLTNKFVLIGLLAVAAFLTLGAINTIDFQQAFAVRQSANCGNGIVVCPNVNACVNAQVLSQESSVSQNC